MRRKLNLLLFKPLSLFGEFLDCSQRVWLELLLVDRQTVTAGGEREAGNPNEEGQTRGINLGVRRRDEKAGATRLGGVRGACTSTNPTTGPGGETTVVDTCETLSP